MAKLKGKGVVVAGLIAGAASLLSKKENRDKLMDYVNQTKEKVNSSGGVQGLVDKVKNAAAGAKQDAEEAVNEAGTSFEETIEDVANETKTDKASDLDGNQMLDEGGGQQAIDAFNELQDDKK
jgi:hypothetical protein